MRNVTIDYLKAILIIAMVIAHTDFFLGQPSSPVPDAILKYFTIFMSLCVFSGLFFCFGFACQLSYLSEDFGQVRRRMTATAGRTLIGYYIAAFAYQLLYLAIGDYSVKDIFRILVFLDIPEFCEFLITFFLMTVLSLVFFKPLKKLTDQPVLVAVWILASLLLPFVIPYKAITNHHLGLLVGIMPRGHFYSFPLLQYSGFFIAGIYFAKNNITFNARYFFVSLALFTCYILYWVFTGMHPGRFPPTFFWLAGCGFLIYLFYLLCGWMAMRNPHIRWLSMIGYNAMFYLVLSNILLFALSKVLKLQGGMIALTGVVIFCVIDYFTGIVRRPAK